MQRDGDRLRMQIGRDGRSSLESWMRWAERERVFVVVLAKGSERSPKCGESGTVKKKPER
jgi:hypothetical protein